MRSHPPVVRVWDRFVRVFHWSLVAAFATAWWSTESIGWLHKSAGYLTLALVAARVAWGFASTNPYARFANFVPGPRTLWRYLGALVRAREPRHLGHNPAGAVMIVFLLLAVAGIGVSGWMMTLDAFWGNDLVETTHVLLVDATVVAVFVHVAANVYGSLRHQDNLIASMLTGNKRGTKHGAKRGDGEPVAGAAPASPRSADAPDVVSPLRL